MVGAGHRSRVAGRHDAVRLGEGPGRPRRRAGLVGGTGGRGQPPAADAGGVMPATPTGDTGASAADTTGTAEYTGGQLGGRPTPASSTARWPPRWCRERHWPAAWCSTSAPAPVPPPNRSSPPGRRWSRRPGPRHVAPRVGTPAGRARRRQRPPAGVGLGRRRRGRLPRQPLPTGARVRRVGVSYGPVVRSWHRRGRPVIPMP